MNDERHAAWEQLHAANEVIGWFVGPPGQRHGGQWAIYAYDPKEKAHIGRRSREWDGRGSDGGGVHPRDGAVFAGDRRGASAEVDAPLGQREKGFLMQVRARLQKHV